MIQAHAEAELHFLEHNQTNIDDLRHSDQGSSCCVFFASSLAVLALEAATPSVDQMPIMSMDNIRKLLLQSVRYWDMHGTADGSRVLDIVQKIAQSRKIAIHINQGERVCDNAALQQVLSEAASPCAMLITAVPNSVQQATWVGNTFLLLVLQSDIVVVDSHAHHRSCPAGAVRAIFRGDARQRACMRWMWDDAHGLLQSINCQRNFVDVTAFHLILQPTAPCTNNIVSDEEDCAASVSRESEEQHKARHPTFVRTCERCQWDKHGVEWQSINPAIAPRPSEWSGSWALGCTLCSQYAALKPCERDSMCGARAGKWANFSVRHVVHKKDILAHCKNSEFHKLAVAKLETTTTADSRAADPLHGVALGGGGNLVPRPDRFIAAITSCTRASSAQAYTAECEKLDLNTSLPSTGVMRDSGHHARAKMIISTSAVMKKKDQAFLQNARRLAFSEDDRCQVKALRVRVVTAEPRIVVKEYLGGLRRDWGFSAEESADATVEALKNMCYVQKGKRSTDNWHKGEDDGINETLWNHVRNITFCGASDGARVALQGIYKLAKDGILPRLRYQFRDRPHTTASVVKCTFRMAAASEKMRKLLITGKRSFARRARNSFRFQSIWVRKQKESLDDIYNIVGNLSYAEQRYSSRSSPMVRFLMKLGPGIDVLVEMSQDMQAAHREDRAWAISVLKEVVGPQGFINLVLFAIDTDFAFVTYKLVRVQDKTSPDIALSAAEVLECIEVCQALFLHGRIFDKEPNGTYTNALLQGLSSLQREVVLPGVGVGVVGWPDLAADSQLWAKPVEHARQLYQYAKTFFDLNFPHYSWRVKFGAFDLGERKLAHDTRVDYISQIAVKEGLDPLEARLQFCTALPHMERLHKHYADNRRAWIEYADTMCRERPGKTNKVKPGCMVIFELILTYVGLMDGSSDVERIFKRLEQIEGKRAVRHHRPELLECICKVAVDGTSNINELARTNPDVMTRSAYGESRVLVTVWNPDNLIKEAQMMYLDFFGGRRLQSRSLVPVPLDKRREQMALARPRLQQRRAQGRVIGPLKATGKHTRLSLAHRTDAWNASVKHLVAEMKAEDGIDILAKRDTFFDTECSSEPPVASALEFLRARIKADERLANNQEKRVGLAFPPQPVRLTKWTGKRKTKSKSKDLDLPPSKKVKHHPAVSPVIDLTVPVVGVNEFEAYLKSSCESLQARLSGGKIMNADKTLAATFTPPESQLRVFITLAACKKHPKSVQVLQKFTPTGTSSSSSDIDMKKIRLATSSDEHWEWFREHPSSCRWIHAGPEDTEFKAVADKLDLAHLPHLMTMSKFCSSLGQRVS